MIPSSDRAFLPLAHWHGLCVPGRTKQKPSLAEALRRDGSRRNQIIRKSLGLMSVVSLEYVVTVGLGTPAVPQTVLIDTGSDLSWIQCKPCNSGECYPQKDPLFDPRSSSTYAPLPCDSGACSNFSDSYSDRCTDDSHCGFRPSYADGSNTTG